MGGARHANGFLDISTVTYWGRNGGLRYDRGLKTCANARCHGGQTTPSWATGSLVVSQDCLKCHQQGNAGNTPQTPQFNSFYSGLYIQAFTPTNLHQFHLDPNNWPVFPNLKNVVCTSCHSPALLTVDRHFGGLALIGFQITAGKLPGDTIQIPGVYLKDPLTGSYPGTCSNVACHTIASPSASWGK
jgi:predicted CxxxxCH...CXXCH cytochrome family protein